MILFADLISIGVSFPPVSQASVWHYKHLHTDSRFIKSLYVHPTQLYIALFMMLLFILMFILYRKGVSKSIINGINVFGYGAINFNIEFVRQEPQVFFMLTLGQVMEIILMFIGLLMILKELKKKYSS